MLVFNEVPMSAFSYEITKDGIAIVTFDLPHEKMNKLTTPVMEELSTLLDELAAKRELKALVFRSGKNENFIVGADIAEIRDITDAKTGELLARRGQTVLNKLEALPFPTVAAIHGPCMGGGMELALACDYRVISNDQRTALALPEVKLGIMPGFGGTQRLPRLIGLSNSLGMILTGKSVYPKKARKTGLADEVVPKEFVLQRAVGKAQKAIGRPKPRGIRAQRPLAVRLIESNPITRRFIYHMAEKNILKETYGNYPAPLAALESVRFGMEHSANEGYKNEAALLGRLAPTEVSKNLISVFYLNEMLKKDALPSPLKIKTAAVLGAGVMGGGIAQLLAEKGISVRMKDINTRAVASGLREAWNIFNKRRKKGVLTAIQARDGYDRITSNTDYTGFANVDTAIEAVVERMDVKKAVLRDFEAVAKENSLYASNTSSLSITEMAAGSRRPGKVVGMHFFNPVEKMPLIEIVRGKETTDEAVSAIATLSRRIGKLPVIVNDGPGFLVNRILMPYLGEAIAMLEQGARINEIDQALLRFGMPMGAFILLDEVGIDIAHKVSGIVHQGLSGRLKPAALLDIVYKEGYYGKKNGKGFYLYQGRKRFGPDPSIYSYVRTGLASGNREKIRDDEIVERPVLLMIKEAALCLDENIIDRPDHLDAALIFGIGFPPFRGGLLRYADKIGLSVVIEKLEGYVRRYGDRFTPPQSLVERARTGKRFYPMRQNKES